MLHLHRADRADALVDALRDLLSAPLPDALAPEVVSVPTRGMERWLTQRMSTALGASPDRADGICANVEFPSPRRLVDTAIAAATGADGAADAWLPERMVWPLLQVVDRSLAQDWLHPLAAHLGATSGDDDGIRRSRRFSAVRHVADLFDRYATQRPAMLDAWARRDDVGGAGEALRADARWQAELWRRVRVEVDEPDPAERLAAACARLRAEPAVVDLPARLSLFGLTRLPAAHARILRALAAHRDVHLFLLHPSPALWASVAAAIEGANGDRGVAARRADDPTAGVPANRLLASWGQDARELQVVATRTGADAGDRVADHDHGRDAPADSLLARIQADIRANRAPRGAPVDPGAADHRPPLDPDDRSVEVHACHGRARQVEVVRDAILHLLADDPTLEPRDVIVMCPDIETFAPLIQATFGAGEAAADDDDLEALPADARPPDLRVRLADRALRQTNPVLGVVAHLLDLAAGRVTASQVLDLADREPVRRRFGLDDDDLARLREWVAASGIRWGLDAAHRTPFKLDGLAAGTWRKGLDRVLVGVAMTEERNALFGDALPLDDVDSGAIDLAGRFAELVDRLGIALEALGAPKTIDAWASAIATAADELTAAPAREPWQRTQLARILHDVAEEATRVEAVDATPLALAEVRALLAERIRGRPTRANFRTGHLTVCTLVPMRSVPHRVVCLLGLDDGVFPRRAPRDGDDLILDEPHVGDRDARSEDRQLLLDALLAATERLIVTYTGNDERTNAPRPPAVPVGELLDAVDRTVRTGDGAPARERVVVRHPLQPFDPRNFIHGRLVPGTVWGFDRVTRDGARALTSPRTAAAPFLAEPLADARGPVVELDDLVRFAERPVRAFLRRRLEVSTYEIDDEVEDGLPVELDGLEQWQVGARLLEGRLAGVDIDACVAAEVGRGSLPPGGLAAPLIARVRGNVEAIAQRTHAAVGEGAEPRSVDVRVALPDGRVLSGTVPGVCGDVLRSVVYSRVSARHRIAAWVRLLALTAARPERPFEAVTIGRAPFDRTTRATTRLARIRTLGEDTAARRATAIAQLEIVLSLYDRGLCEPLPLACLSGEAYAMATRDGAPGIAAAKGEWESTWNFDREDREPEHRLVFGGPLTLSELLAIPPSENETGAGWDERDGSRFGRLARRLWAGPLAFEQLEDR